MILENVFWTQGSQKLNWKGTGSLGVITKRVDDAYGNYLTEFLVTRRLLRNFRCSSVAILWETSPTTRRYYFLSRNNQNTRLDLFVRKCGWTTQSSCLWLKVFGAARYTDRPVMLKPRNYEDYNGSSENGIGKFLGIFDLSWQTLDPRLRPLKPGRNIII